MSGYVIEGNAMEHPEVGLEDKHTRMGISSFVLAILAGVLAFLLTGLAGVLEVYTPGGINDVAAVLVGLGIFGVLFANLVGLGLGIAGLVQRRRKKLLSILGAIGNASLILMVLALISYGSTV